MSALSLLIACLAASANAAPQDTSIRAGRGAISGRVVEAEVNRPIRDAVVTLLSSAGVTLKTSTDENGRYTFEGIGVGGYRVIVAHEGYAPAEYRPFGARMLGSQPDAVRVLPEGYKVSVGVVWLGLTQGQVRTDVDFTLVRGGSISGRVTRADGRPVKSAVVRAVLMLEDGGFTFSERTQAFTSDGGEYVIADLAPGLYRVSVTWHDPERVKARARLDPGPTYFPGTGALDEATSLRITSGSVIRSVDIPLLPSDVFRLAGHVLRSASEGPIEAHIVAPPATVRTVDIAEDGAFEVTHLSPGRYTFWARAATSEGSEAVWTTVDMGADMNGLILPMSSTGEIRGRLLRNDGLPVTDTQVIAQLVDGNGAPLDVLPRDRADVEHDGTFVIRGLFGDRQVRVSGNHWQVERVLVGKRTVDRLSFTCGDHFDGLVVVVKPR